jgi:hypothetical protein
VENILLQEIERIKKHYKEFEIILNEMLIYYKNLKEKLK